MNDPGILHLLVVFVGGAIGGMARFAVASFIDRVSAGTFPWGTLGVNVSGSALIGLFAALLLREADAGTEGLRWTLLAIGIVGSYTTVSSFSLQTLALARSGRIAAASANVVASLVLCLAATVCGFVIGTGIL